MICGFCTATLFCVYFYQPVYYFHSCLSNQDTSARSMKVLTGERSLEQKGHQLVPEQVDG